MWMARGQQETRLQEPGAEWGEVTLSGDTVGVSLAGGTPAGSGLSAGRVSLGS